MARNRSQPKEISERRKSIAFFPTDARHHIARGDLHMLFEDMDHRILPMGHSSRNWPTYGILVEPFSEQASLCLETALSLDEREYDLPSAVGTFVRRSLSHILNQGEAFFELVFDHDEEPKGFFLAPFPPGEVKIYDGVVTQILPLEVQVALGLTQSFVEIPEANVLHFSFPASQGGKSAVLELTSGLESLGSSMMPRFAEGDFGRLRSEFGLHVSTTYRQLRDEALSRLTAQIGWNGRFLLDEKVTEFYKMYRMLKFSVFLAHLREHIVQCVNNFNESPMRRIGQEGVITFTGIPTSKELEVKIQELLDGKLTFKEALDFCYIL